MASPRRKKKKMPNEQQSGKMWSGRFREPLNPQFEAWQRSLAFDWRLLPQEIAASKAHARTIAAAGVLTHAELETMLRGLDAIIPRVTKRGAELATEEARNEPGHGRVRSAAPGILVSKAEDVHHFVELELTEEIGELALKLHTGRSRNEQIATDLRLFVRDSIEQTTERHRGLGRGTHRTGARRRRCRDAELYAFAAG